MNLPQVSIRFPVLALMVSLLITLFGAVSYQRIGLDRFPVIEFPMVSVTTLLPGANPDIVDSSISNVIEKAINSVPGINHIQSNASPGVSVSVVTFDLNKDVDVAFNEVQSKINQVINRLPAGAQTPVVQKIAFGAIPIMWLTLQGDRSLQELNLYADKVIKKQLESINGVGEVRLGGGRERTIRVALDLERMTAHGLTVQDVIAAFAREHLQIPGGFLTADTVEQMIKLDVEFHQVEALGELIIKNTQGFNLKLKDIADISDGLDDNRKYALYNGEATVGLGIIKVSGGEANAVAVVKAVKERLEKSVIPNLPNGMTLHIASDDSSLILDIVKALEEHLLEGTLLTALVVWFFLKSIRATLIIAVTIPVSLLGAVAVMYFNGYTFNTLTLLGLLLLIGIVVDDAIVVLENIYRHRETSDQDPKEAAEHGTREVYFAVMASTLTLVSIFAPVIFLEGIIGRFFQSFAVVVTMGVLVSFFLAMTLTPMLSSRYLQVAPSHGLLYRIFDAPLKAIEWAYRKLLKGVLRFKWLVLILTVAAVYPSGFFFGAIGKGFLPLEDDGRFLVTFKTPLGSSLATTQESLEDILQVLDKHQDAIYSTFATIADGEAGKVNEGSIFVALKPKEQRQQHMYDLIAQLREELAVLPGVEAFPSPVPNMGGARGEPLQFVLRGTDLNEVSRLGEILKVRLAKYPELGAVDLDLQMNLPQVSLQIDRQRAANLGLSAQQIAQTVNVLAGGVDVAKFNEEPGDGERYDIRLQAKPGSLMSVTDLSQVYLRTNQGELVRLDSLASFHEETAPAVKTRYDLLYSGNFYATPSIDLNAASIMVQTEAAQILIPGYEVNMIGQAEEFAKTAYYMMFTFMTAIVLVYMVLASQFNSFIQPLVVMLALPLAAVGGVAGLWVMDMGLNVFSMMGMVLLMGLVAKNSILLVDLANQYRQKGMGIDEALYAASPVRLRPILMTSLTIILTMLPAAMGTGAGVETNGPLAVAVIGGILTSTLLSLVVVPAGYGLAESGLEKYALLKQRLAAKWRPKNSAPTAQGTHE